jgi:hypothetical protein
VTAADVIAALRRRHAATQKLGDRTVPGAWTCVEELLGCDLLAIAAHKRPVNGPAGANHPRVGYEVKVSRSDYRKELRIPSKRADAVARTHAFYLAVPAGLLKPVELVRRAPAGDDDRTLWIPEDVGLVVVNGRGCNVVHEAPVRTSPRAIDARTFGVCARYISSHPDPRHEGVVAADREHCRHLRDDERRRRAESDERWRQYVADE